MPALSRTTMFPARPRASCTRCARSSRHFARRPGSTGKRACGSTWCSRSCSRTRCAMDTAATRDAPVWVSLAAGEDRRVTITLRGHRAAVQPLRAHVAGYDAGDRASSDGRGVLLLQRLSASARLRLPLRPQPHPPRAESAIARCPGPDSNRHGLAAKGLQVFTGCSCQRSTRASCSRCPALAIRNQGRAHGHSPGRKPRLWSRT